MQTCFIFFFKLSFIGFIVCFIFCFTSLKYFIGRIIFQYFFCTFNCVFTLS